MSCRSVSLLFLLLLPVFLVSVPSTTAQESASLRGYVRDASTEETLRQATVAVKETGQGTVTNNEGYYTLPGLAPGTYTVVFSYVGYQSRTKTVTLAAGQKRRIDVTLLSADLQAEGIVVTDTTKETERDLGTDLRVTTITELPSAGEPDVFRSLSLLPGITTSSDYSSSIYVRGGSPDQTLVLLDGTTVYNPSHLSGFFSTFNSDAIKDVKLHKGAYPAKYGGRLGGVVSVQNKDGNRKETTGGLSVGLLMSRAYVEGPYLRGKDSTAAGSYMVAVRRSTFEPLLEVLGQRAGVDEIPNQLWFYDVNAKLNYDLGPSDKLSLSVYGAKLQ